MLDTIVSINNSGSKLDLRSLEDPSKLIDTRLYRTKNDGRNMYLESVGEPALEKKYGYLPQVNITYRQDEQKGSYILVRFRLQFSAPKILFGTNFYMVREADLEDLLTKLSSILGEYGINIPAEQLRLLRISSFATCFNLIMPSSFGDPITYMTAYMKNMDQGKCYKNRKNTEYLETQNGLCITQYSKNSSFKMYVKSANLINNAKTKEEKLIAELINQGIVTKNIMRIEKTFQRIQATKLVIQRIFNKTQDQDVYITDIFNDFLCRTILNETIEKTTNAYELLTIEIGKLSENLPPKLLQTRLIDTGKKLHLKNGELTQFVHDTLLVSTLGWSAYKKYYDEGLGKKGTRYRSRMKTSISKVLQNEDIFGFETIDIANEIKAQLTDFNTYSNVEEFLKIYNEIEKKPEIVGELSEDIQKQYITTIAERTSL